MATGSEPAQRHPACNRAISVPFAAHSDPIRRITQVRTDGRPNLYDGLLVRRGRASNRPLIVGGPGMSRVHSLGFEALESRELLSRAHPAIAHAAKDHARPAAVGAPLVLSGTLTVNNRAATTNQNLDGGYTNSVPVSGQLSGLGQVSGVWYESTDSYGDYLGPDTITLHARRGASPSHSATRPPGPPTRPATTPSTTSTPSMSSATRAPTPGPRRAAPST